MRTAVVISLVAVVVGAALGWLALEAVGDAKERVSGVPRDMQVDEFERRVLDYLVYNPEIIVATMQRFEKRRAAVAQDEIKSAIAAHADELLRDSASPVGGNPNGDATIVEFFDYNCPYCRSITPDLAEAEASDPELRIVYKEIPILGSDSVFAAKAALAAHRQGKYVAFHRALMNAKGVAAEGLVLALAAKIGLDVERLKRDMGDPSIQAAIDRNMALARALRITGTPSFVIGHEIVRGAVDLSALQALIEKARAAQ